MLISIPFNGGSMRKNDNVKNIKYLEDTVEKYHLLIKEALEILEEFKLSTIEQQKENLRIEEKIQKLESKLNKPEAPKKITSVTLFRKLKKADTKKRKKRNINDNHAKENTELLFSQNDLSEKESDKGFPFKIDMAAFCKQFANLLHFKVGSSTDSESNSESGNKLKNNDKGESNSLIPRITDYLPISIYQHCSAYMPTMSRLSSLTKEELKILELEDQISQLEQKHTSITGEIKQTVINNNELVNRMNSNNNKLEKLLSQFNSKPSI